MSCRCSPCLVRLMSIFASMGHVNSGCCGDAAHAARKSDHNANASGYAHAQDIHEKNDHDMKPYVDFIMKHPGLFPQVRYLIYEGVIYYPHAAGSRRPGAYAYTGPNDHAHHLHVSIFADQHFYTGSWYVADAYGAPEPPAETPEEDDMIFVQVVPNLGDEPQKTDPTYVIGAKVVKVDTNEGFTAFAKRFGPPLRIGFNDLAQFLLELNGKTTP